MLYLPITVTQLPRHVWAPSQSLPRVADEVMINQQGMANPTADKSSILRGIASSRTLWQTIIQGIKPSHSPKLRHCLHSYFHSAGFLDYTSLRYGSSTDCCCLFGSDWNCLRGPSNAIRPVLWSRLDCVLFEQHGWNRRHLLQTRHSERDRQPVRYSASDRCAQDSSVGRNCLRWAYDQQHDRYCVGQRQYFCDFFSLGKVRVMQATGFREYANDLSIKCPWDPRAVRWCRIHCTEGFSYEWNALDCDCALQGLLFLGPRRWLEDGAGPQLPVYQSRLGRFALSRRRPRW